MSTWPDRLAAGCTNSAAHSVCSLPHAPRACPGRVLILRKSGKPDLRWGRGGEGGGAVVHERRLTGGPPPLTPPPKGEGNRPSLRREGRVTSLRALPPA